MQNIYKNWKLKRHVEKFGSKNNGYFNYFNRAWFEEHQEILIWLLNHWLLKYWFRWILRIHKDCKFSEYIDEIKPNTYRILLDNNTYRSDFRTHQKFSKRIYYAFYPYWYLLHSLDFLIQKTVAPEFSFGFDTLTVYPDANPETVTGDAGLGREAVNKQYDVIFDGNATRVQNSVSSDVVELDLSATANSYSYIYAMGMTFDTGTISASASISDATGSMYSLYGGYSDSDSTLADSELLGFSSWSPSVNFDFVVADWTTISYSGMNNGNYTAKTLADSRLNMYNNVTLTTSKVTKAGITKLCYKGTFNNWLSGQTYYYVTSCLADNTGTNQDPKLVVTYTIPPVAPTVTTQAVSSIADTTATGNGNVTSDGGATITERGVCWKTSTGPTTADSKATSAGTTGAYTASITGLTASTLYYVKAYAINSVGTSYGSEVTFTSSTTPTAISAIFGIPIADIKTINGIAGASIKSIMGLTYVQPAPIVPWYGERGVFGGGYSSSYDNTIDYITISTTGNAVDFGDLTQARYYAGACSNGSRGVWAGGQIGTESNVIDYITIATTGNSTDFGDSTTTRSTFACSNNTRGLFAGGGSSLNIIDYITIATTGNATDFGDLTIALQSLSACASATRGIFAGGSSTEEINIIQYVTISTTGNATDFGDLTTTVYHLAACSNTTRGIIGGGIRVGNNSNVIEYITIATTGNSTDFGDLTEVQRSEASCSNGTRGCFGSGFGASANTNTISYITIDTTGNATDFGDVTLSRRLLTACSGN